MISVLTQHLLNQAENPTMLWGGRDRQDHRVHAPEQRDPAKKKSGFLSVQQQKANLEL